MENPNLLNCLTLTRNTLPLSSTLPFSSIFLPSSLFLPLSLFFLIYVSLTPSLSLHFFSLYLFLLNSLFLPSYLPLLLSFSLPPSPLPLALIFFPPSILPLFFSLCWKYSFSTLHCITLLPLPLCSLLPVYSTPFTPLRFPSISMIFCYTYNNV